MPRYVKKSTSKLLQQIAFALTRNGVSPVVKIATTEYAAPKHASKGLLQASYRLMWDAPGSVLEKAIEIVGLKTRLVEKTEEWVVVVFDVPTKWSDDQEL